MTLGEMLSTAPVVPVLVIEEVEIAEPLARALIKGGLKVLEITLRTPAAIEALRRIAGEVEGAIVGAGTVLNAADAERATKAGARFLVSPGYSRTLAAATATPLLPGVATASEAMAVLEAGFACAKLFPAEPIGGVEWLRALNGPLPQLRFCPTGGISSSNAARYLALPNVVCVGGSWLTPKAALEARDWDQIEALARAAYRLRPRV
jgi:2-dehydro-3-deoxyphosphogluconate aldolase/(4S)-4-hydroxy-2-oxoglutarate aldolase